MSMQLSDRRGQFNYAYYGVEYTCFGCEAVVADVEFAHFTDCFMCRESECIWYESMKIRKSDIRPQQDLFAPSEDFAAETAWYGDADED